MPDIYINLTLFSFLYIVPCVFIYLYFKVGESTLSYNFFNYYLATSLLTFCLIYTLKNFSFGGDYYNYFQIMQGLSSEPSILSSNLVNQDPIFWLFMYSISTVSDNSYLFGIIFSLIFFIFLFILSKLEFETKIIVLSIFCILLSRPFLEAAMNPLRSSLALIFIFLSFYSSIRKSILSAIFFFFISINIHLFISILFLLFLPFLYLRLYYLKVVLLISIAICLFLNFYGTNFPIMEFYNEYLSRGDHITGISVPINYVLFLIPFVLIPIFFLLSIEIDSEVDIIYLKLLIIIFSFLLATLTINPVGMRFSILLLPLSLLLFFKYMERRSIRVALYYMSGLLMFNYLVLTFNIIDNKYYFDSDQSRYTDFSLLKRTL